MTMKDWELTISPAWGRDYQTAEEAYQAWMDREDFKIRTPGHPSYINRSDAEKYGVPGNVVWIRYAKLTMKVAVRLIEGQWIKGPDDDSNV